MVASRNMQSRRLLECRDVPPQIPPGTSMLGQDLSKRGDSWYEEHLARLGKDGICCTKVGTNGKPYERYVGSLNSLKMGLG